MDDESQRSGHHPGPPGKDAAVDAAAIFHQKSLKGAEKQHADQITQVVEGTQQHQFCSAQSSAQVENAEEQVDQYPGSRYFKGASILIGDCLA